MSKTKGSSVTKLQIASLMTDLAKADIDVTQTEQLCTFDGHPGYTLSQDEQ